MIELSTVPLGKRVEMGHHTFTADEIADFGARFESVRPYAPAPAARPMASAMHVCCVHMRLLIDTLGRGGRVASNAARPKVGPSPGVRQVEWPHPVYAGDTVSFSRELVDRRPSASRPGWEIQMFQSLARNQNGDVVMSMLASTFIESVETTA